MPRQVVCPECNSPRLEKVYELIIAAEGGTTEDPVGELIALKCGKCGRRIEIGDLVVIDEDTGEVHTL